MDEGAVFTRGCSRQAALHLAPPPVRRGPHHRHCPRQRGLLARSVGALLPLDLALLLLDAASAPRLPLPLDLPLLTLSPFPLEKGRVSSPAPAIALRSIPICDCDLTPASA